jgi:hypothetical protein
MMIALRGPDRVFAVHALPIAVAGLALHVLYSVVVRAIEPKRGPVTADRWPPGAWT